MKKCPFCSGDIKDDAKKCRHCGEWLEGVAVNIKKQLISKKPTTTWTKTWNVGVVIILFGLLFGIIVSHQSNRIKGERASAMQACLQGKTPKEGGIVSLSGKEFAEKQFKENRCEVDDLDVDYKKTKMDDRVDICRNAKRNIDTYEYNQCLKEKGL